ncbi:MAG: hypothetical protein AUK47_22595 [Deltaproteobacteria bacterium CG2_30_63_29]|nr:MAG: hypothetical protein AUK47_22595 [Deltaproteobacteria bacterium CG2_30_63_29]
MMRASPLVLLLFCCAACWQQQGHRPVLGPEETWRVALDTRERGDLIAAEDLFWRLRTEHAASLYGVLATLELRSWSPEAAQDAHVGGFGARRAAPAVQSCIAP